MKVIFRVILKVKKPSINPKSVVVVKIGQKLNKEIKKGRIGNIRVAPELLKIKGS